MFAIYIVTQCDKQKNIAAYANKYGAIQMWAMADCCTFCNHESNKFKALSWNQTLYELYYEQISFRLGVTWRGQIMAAPIWVQNQASFYTEVKLTLFLARNIRI